jgi:4-diphosphocytidyl-2C-methyl-D-erythritol kinase
VATVSAPARSVRSIRREARAKINLFLRVRGEREDGYHEIESLVVPISLADLVTVRASSKLRVAVKGEKTLTGDVPVGGLNLALVAALALADGCPDAGGALIEIDKRIPVAAGLGGGCDDRGAERALGVRGGRLDAGRALRADRLGRPGDAGRIGGDDLGPR